MASRQPWEGNNLQNSSQLMRNGNGGPNMPTIGPRTVPVLPPRPPNSSLISNNGYSNYMSPSGMGYSGISTYGGGYGTYGIPYRSPMYNTYGSSYGGYNNMGVYGNIYPNYSADDHERRFIQYAEESSRNTFASVESIVRAFNSISMMLDNTFFAMTSSFRAVLSVAENFGRLRSMFGHIWYSVNIFRFLTWLYKRLLRMLGVKAASGTATAAWNEAAHGITSPTPAGTPGPNWPTIAFLGVLVSAPYIISRFLPKYEDKGNPENWKSPGIRAKAVFDFIATSANELTIQTNDIILLAPTYIQDEMNLKNTGWAFAVSKGKSGVVPLNYLVISKNRPIISNSEKVPVPKPSNLKTHTKRVSFGENQIFENIDINDYISGSEPIASSQVEKIQDISNQEVKEKSDFKETDVCNKIEDESQEKSK